MGPIRALLLFIRGVLRESTNLAVENLALRQQLVVLRRLSKRPQLRKRDLTASWYKRTCREQTVYANPDGTASEDKDSNTWFGIKDSYPCEDKE